jgi:hypothetical protein
MEKVNTQVEVEDTRVAELVAADAADELSIEELDTVAAGLSVSSLLSAACPVSSFSSISN